MFQYRSYLLPSDTVYRAVRKQCVTTTSANFRSVWRVRASVKRIPTRRMTSLILATRRRILRNDITMIFYNGMRCVNFGDRPSSRHINPQSSVAMSAKSAVVCALICSMWALLPGADQLPEFLNSTTKTVLDAQGVNISLIMMKPSGSELSFSLPCGPVEGIKSWGYCSMVRINGSCD